MNKIEKGSIKSIFLMLFLTVFASAEGLDKVNTLMTSIQKALSGISIATVTVAILWVGYKVLFTGAALRDMASTIIGALIIAGAAEIAKMLVGS